MVGEFMRGTASGTSSKRVSSCSLGGVGGVVFFGTRFRGFLQAAWRELTASSPGPRENSRYQCRCLGDRAWCLSAGSGRGENATKPKLRADCSLSAVTNRKVHGNSGRDISACSADYSSFSPLLPSTIGHFSSHLSLRVGLFIAERDRVPVIPRSQDAVSHHDVHHASGDHRPGRAWPMKPCSPPSPHLHSSTPFHPGARERLWVCRVLWVFAPLCPWGKGKNGGMCGEGLRAPPMDSSWDWRG
ncbi:hypothetical protein B0J18DRAFT_290411 [Chaetomium sp. MPI-SDFR-AT-0129]|nr:hypothetical protein B0J18DRAFT_290411 [Chaetomium sp. MPI-SDFR-AT-0129]